MSNCTGWSLFALGGYIKSWMFYRDNDEFSLYTNIRCIFHLYYHNWASIFCSNENHNLIEVPPKEWTYFSTLDIIDKNPLDSVSLHIIVIEYISYIEIYNMSTCLLIIIKIVKVKVFGILSCVPFVDVLHRIWGEGCVATTETWYFYF